MIDQTLARTRLTLLALACAGLVAGCEDSLEPFPDAGSSTAVSVSGAVTGADTMILLGFLHPPGGSPRAPIARLCVPLRGDPAPVAGVFYLPGDPGDPCDAGAEAIVAAGTYQIFFGTYVPGEQTPRRCATTTITSTGDGLAVPLPALGACP